MRTILILLFLLTLVAHARSGEPTPADHDLEDAEVGMLPAEWDVDKTGLGIGSAWMIVTDETAPRGPKVLAQTAESLKHVFNLCVLEESSFLNGEIRVTFKAVAGKIDQGGGLVWRYVNSNNYYVARVNPLEKNLRFDRVIAGRRMRIAIKEDLEVATGEWHTLTIQTAGPDVICLLDGVKQLDATDSTYKKPGKVGLWTKSDAQTYFDDFVVTPKE